MARRNGAQPQIGATLALVAFSLAALLGLAALALDLATVYAARQRAQAVADAAALAGGQKLPAPDAATQAQATAAASPVITANSPPGAVFAGPQVTYPSTVEADDGTTQTVNGGDAVTVQGYVNAPLSFAPVVGYRPQARDGTADTLSVPAHATVTVQNACGLPAQSNVAPFGVIGDDPNNATAGLALASLNALLSTAPGSRTPRPSVYQPLGSRVTLKLSLWDSAGRLVSAGNTDPLQTGGTASYQTAIKSRSEQPLTVGQALTTQSGNQMTATQQGVSGRLAPSDTAFTHDFSDNHTNQSTSAYTEWFFGDHTKPIDTSLPPVTDTNTTTGQTYTFYYHVDPHRQEATDAHLMIVPVISQGVKNAPGQVTILAFAAFFMEQPFPSTANWIAQGRFVGLTVPGSTGGACVGGGDKTPPRLVE